MSIEDDKLYEEIGRAWLHYTSWRERIFAGYLTVLAGLAYAFSKETTIPVRAAVFAFGILISVVFRMLDLRTTELVNLCQAEGETLASSKGFFGELNRRRFASTDGVSYAKAINVLVAGVVGTGAVGLSAFLLWWWAIEDGVSFWWPVVAAGLAFVIFMLLQKITGNAWKRERNDYFARFPKTQESPIRRDPQR